MRIFLSWCRQDVLLKERLLDHLLPALTFFPDFTVEWWDDSHLVCGEELTSGIVGRIDEADAGLLLLSTRYFGRPFVREHELPRFAGPDADKVPLPVVLSPLPPLDDTRDLGGIERRLVFTHDGKSYAELPGHRRVRFANELADAIRGRALGQTGYRPL